MRRSKELNPSKKPLWPALIGGNYQPHKSIRLVAREDDPPGTPPALDETGVNNIVHKAITKRLSDPAFIESISNIAGQAATSAITEASAGIAEQVAATLAASGPAPGAPPPDGTPPAPAPVAWKDSPEYKAMEKRDQVREDERTAEKAERQAERDAKDRADERSTLEAALRAGGVEEINLRGCVSTLLHEDKVMQRDASGQIVYRVNHGEYNEDMDVAKGVKSFLDTDEGKTYLPATGARGTGATGDTKNVGNNIPTGGQKQTKEQAAQILSDTLFAGG